MRLLMLICILALLLTGCTPTINRQKQTIDGVTIFLENPEKITLSREVEVIVTLVAADQRVINNATVTLDLNMPEMPMGQNRPLADPLGGGRYRIRTTYTMIGTWKTTVIAKIGEQEYRATFDQMVTGLEVRNQDSKVELERLGQNQKIARRVETLRWSVCVACASFCILTPDF